jgi:hypothetical protein
VKPHPISWEEEHRAFRKRARQLRIGDKWKFGIYQDVPDDKPPATQLKDNSFYEFLVPEQHLSLKLFFDNLSNYAICAAFAALGAWLWIVRGGVANVVQHSPWVLAALAAACWLLVTCLLVLNVLQTWFLSNELFWSIRGLHISRTRIYPPPKNGLHMILAFGHMIGSLLSDWLLLLTIRLFAVALVALCIGFVVYAVLASPGMHGAA